MASLKLKIDLVPEPLWGISAYRLLGKSTKWKAIRKDVLRQAKNSCSVCRASGGRLSCHEKWRYDDGKRIATLVGFVMHCDPCDLAAHMGRSFQHGFGDMAIDQFCRINHCTAEKAHALFADAMATWRKRSGKKWTVAVAKPLLAKYPALSVLQNKEIL